MGGVAEEFETLRRARPCDPADELGERVLFRIRMRDGVLPPGAGADLAFAKMKDAARRLIKAGFDPGQPRDDIGRWTDGGGSAHTGDGPVAAGFERFVADALSDSTLPILRVAGIPENETHLTVQKFMSKYCDGGIKSRMPGQFLEMPISDVMKLNQSHNRMAQRCLKLLMQDRFRK